MKKILVLVTILIVALGAGGWYVWQRNNPVDTAPAQQSTSRPTTSEPTEEAGFDKKRYSIDEPGSPWWIVNKTRPLPDGYVPPDLVVPNVQLRLKATEEQMKFSQQAATDLETMFDAANSQGVVLVFGSGYRSHQYQAALYNGYVASVGQAEADRTSARPGTSEHQTGLAFDATAASGQCHLEKCFADLAEGQWLKAHAHEFGFIIRYLEGKEAITGYDYEPWHLRYVGKELAAELHETAQTMEEFFELPAAPSY